MHEAKGKTPFPDPVPRFASAQRNKSRPDPRPSQGLFCPKLWQRVLGVANPVGWRLQGFVEDPRCAEVWANGRVRWALSQYLRHLHRRPAPNRPYPLRRDLPDLDLEGKRLQSLQGWLLGQLRQRDIALEVCPSGNLLIRRLASLREHPLLGLARKLPMLISTDNPATFATDLAFEYRLVYETALEGLADPAEAQGFFRDLLEQGRRYRFADGAGRRPRRFPNPRSRGA